MQPHQLLGATLDLNSPLLVRAGFEAFRSKWFGQQGMTQHSQQIRASCGMHCRKPTLRCQPAGKMSTAFIMNFATSQC